MSAVSLKGRERRNSARGRLQSPAPSQCELPQIPNKNSRRVKSASHTRARHEASADIYPEPSGHKEEWGVTKYSEDYGPKASRNPVPVRPCSPTRRNNPHPSQSFMVWKYPSRVHEHKKAVQPDPDEWKLTQERFYDDYTDDKNTGDARNEVPITNVAKIAFPGIKEHAADQRSVMAGLLETKINLTHNLRVNGAHTGLRPATRQSRMLHNNVKSETLPVFKEWLKGASSHEHAIMLKMLKAADDNSEDTRLQKAVSDVLQPDSVERVQDWLKTANSSERQVVLHVLETLAVAADDSYAHPHPYQLLWPARHQHRQRSHSCPISLRRPMAGQVGVADPALLLPGHYATGENYSRHAPKPARPRSATNRLTLAQESLSEINRKLKKMSTLHKEGSRREPELWHHQVKKAVVENRVFHPGAVFGQPKKPRGQHFAIHPEWPIA